VHHDLLVSGGSEGSILHWSLKSSSPTPRASLDEAHDSNVWCLAYHPLGHLLVSASNDHTTRFWCRERPLAEVGGEWKAGGEKPPEAGVGMSTQEEDEDYVPGFGLANSGGMQDGYGMGAGGREDDSFDRAQRVNGIPYGNQGFTGGNDDFIPGLGGETVAPRRSGPLPSQDTLYPGPGSNGGFGGGRGSFRRRGRGRE